jgi:tetratricopeptide (TPR) repeat protein
MTRFLPIGLFVIIARCALTADDTAITVPADVLELARQAGQKFERGDYGAAETLYEQILERHPDNLHALTNLGVVRFRAGKFDAAEQALRRAIAIAPDDAFSHTTLGIVYFGQRRYDDAIDALTKALAIDSTSAAAHRYLGLAASQKGWHEVAQKELERAHELDPRRGWERSFPPSPVGDFLTPLEKSRLQLPSSAK